MQVMNEFKENDVVTALVDAASSDGINIPAGMEGTVVSVFTVPQPACEVEFPKPGSGQTDWTIAKYKPADLKPVERSVSEFEPADADASEQGIRLTRDVQSDPGQPVHPFTIPAGVYGQYSLGNSNPDKNEFYVQFTLPTSSIYGYNWVYATIGKECFEPGELALAKKKQDIPVITF